MIFLSCRPPVPVTSLNVDPGGKLPWTAWFVSGLFLSWTRRLKSFAEIPRENLPEGEHHDEVGLTDRPPPRRDRGGPRGPRRDRG